mmetsp:Transcript_72428/g.143825  ORF Transcript_72428/g.143825 Transcript_72428/m.143825 type:complete len:99 (-) Transcript_72428:54-350(-)
MLRCLSKGSAAAHAHSTQPTNGLQCAEVLPMLPLAVEEDQPPVASQPAISLSIFTLAKKRMYCCARTLYAIQTAFGWVPGDDLCAGTHLVGKVVLWRR